MHATIRFLAAALAILDALPARASDGRTEINHSKALAGGVTSGDAAGYPVWITTPGSYALTSDLVPGPGAVAIEIRNGPITLDLNGFALRGPGIGSGTASGITANQQTAQYSSIRNGMVRGFRGRGIDLPTSSGVELDGLLVLDNALGGIAVGDRGLVRNTRVYRNGVAGMTLGLTTSYVSCTIADTVGGTSVVRGISMGQNFCDDFRCGPRPRPRRYYLTQFGVTGGEALAACQPGFHMASLFEIWDPSGLSYDTNLGFTREDSGQGPPRGAAPLDPLSDARGWVRTGDIAATGTAASFANCVAWTTASASQWGTTADPQGGWDPEVPGGWLTSTVDPWNAGARRCNEPAKVWCVEDLP